MFQAPGINRGNFQYPVPRFDGFTIQNPGQFATVGKPELCNCPQNLKSQISNPCGDFLSVDGEKTHLCRWRR
ncbi:MAG: hypothetical protein ACHBN1_05235 [Heteroscytonema crispum UTEX LB 1556]